MTEVIGGRAVASMSDMEIYDQLTRCRGLGGGGR